MDIISSLPLSTILNSGFALNGGRIARIIQARTLEDASHMGLVDRLFDKFLRKGGKRAAIARLYRQVSQPGAGEPRDLSPAAVVARFMQLRAFANSEYRSAFQLTLCYDPLEQAPWSYLLQIGNYRIYQSPPLDYRLDDQFAEVCTIKVCQSLDDALMEVHEQLTPERYIQSQVESMADAPAVRQKLLAVLDDPAYGRANLVRITDSDDSTCFLAHFRHDVLALANRCATHDEFRGSRLKTALLETDYVDLRALCRKSYMTKEDALLKYLARPHWLQLVDYIGDAVYRPEVRQLLSGFAVGETTACELFNLAQPDHGDSDGRQARMTQ